MITQSFNVRHLSPRQTLLGSTGTALENMIVDPLVTGSVCLVVAEQAFYRLDKTSTTAPSGTDVIATSRGTGVPGRWFKMGAAAGQTIYPLSNVFFIDANTVTPVPEQDGKITSAFATLAQFLALPGPKVGYFTPVGVSYGPVVLSDGSEMALIGLTVTAIPPLIFDAITLTGESSISIQNAITGAISIGEACSLRIQSSRYDSLTIDPAPGSIEADLVTLGDSRTGGAAPPVGGVNVLDAPTDLIEFNVPTLLAGASAEVSILVPNIHPGDTFAIAPQDGTSNWPANAIVGQPRCEVAGTLIVPVIASIGGVGSATCNMKVTLFPVTFT